MKAPVPLIPLPLRIVRASPYDTAEAFARLYERTHRQVFRFAYGFGSGSIQDAEDITAETFARAWKSRRRFSGDTDAALGWLLQIARRLVIDQFRRRGRGVMQDLDSVVVIADDASPEERAAVEEQVQILLRLLHMLADEKREMLVLRYLLGWRVDAIAAHFDQNPNTISVNLRRALAHLRKNWPHSDGEEMTDDDATNG